MEWVNRLQLVMVTLTRMEDTTWVVNTKVRPQYQAHKPLFLHLCHEQIYRISS